MVKSLKKSIASLSIAALLLSSISCLSVSATSADSTSVSYNSSANKSISHTYNGVNTTLRSSYFYNSGNYGSIKADLMGYYTRLDPVGYKHVDITSGNTVYRSSSVTNQNSVNLSVTINGSSASRIIYDGYTTSSANDSTHYYGMTYTIQLNS